MSTPNCSVCDDPFTKIRHLVPCANCSYIVCSRCVKMFLLSDGVGAVEPHCMNCRHVWDRVFLDEFLPHSWIESDLKHHRANILWDRERSMMPATQDAVEFELEKRAATQTIKELDVTIQQMKIPLSQFYDDVWRRRSTAHGGDLCERNFETQCIKRAVYDNCEICMLNIGNDERKVFRAQYKEIMTQISNIRTHKQQLYNIVYGHHRRIDGIVQEVERRKFIAACPDTECRGFLSTAYKCGVCAKHYCSACRELKVEGSIHTCDPDLVATISEIVKNSHPCPTCGTAISKIDGCDQMYCTGCFTAFSYSTGKIVTGVIHNPHYFERMRKLHDGVVPVQGQGQGQGANPCGLVVDLYTLPVIVRRNEQLMAAYRLINHIQQVELPQYPTPVVLQNNEDIRVKYLLKDIDEKRIKQLIQQRDRVRQKKLEIRATLELCLLFVVDFFIDAPSIEKLPILQNTIREFINEPLKKIGRRYTNMVPNIDMDGYGWKLSNVKVVNKGKKGKGTGKKGVAEEDKEGEGEGEGEGKGEGDVVFVDNLIELV